MKKIQVTQVKFARVMQKITFESAKKIIPQSEGTFLSLCSNVINWKLEIQDRK